jgi:hypothetical protein
MRAKLLLLFLLVLSTVGLVFTTQAGAAAPRCSVTYTATFLSGGALANFAAKDTAPSPSGCQVEVFVYYRETGNAIWNGFSSRSGGQESAKCAIVSQNSFVLQGGATEPAHADITFRSKGPSPCWAPAWSFTSSPSPWQSWVKVSYGSKATYCFFGGRWTPAVCNLY